MIHKDEVYETFYELEPVAEARNLSCDFDYKQGGCTISLTHGDHLPVKVEGVKTMDEFIAKLPEAVDDWEANLRSYRELVGVTSGSRGIRESNEFWNDFYECLESYHSFVDDVTVLKKLHDHGFSYHTRDDYVMLLDTSVDGAFIEVKGNHLGTVPMYLPEAVRNFDFDDMASRLTDYHQEERGRDVFYRTRLLGMESRLTALTEDLSDFKSWDIPVGLSPNVAKKLDAIYKEEEATALSQQPELDLSLPKKEKSFNMDMDLPF